MKLKSMKKFSEDQTGTITIFAVITFLVIVLMVGSAIDMARFESERSRVQAVTDAAVLTAATLENCASSNKIDAEQVGNSYIAKANLRENFRNTIKMKVTGDCGNSNREISAEGIKSVDTMFIKHLRAFGENFGRSELRSPIVATASYTTSPRNVEVSLIVDLSNRRSLNQVKATARKFVNIALDNNVEGQDPIVTINLIPYAHSVSVGVDLYREKFNKDSNSTFDYSQYYDASKFPNFVKLIGGGNGYCPTIKNAAFNSNSLLSSEENAKMGHTIPFVDNHGRSIINRDLQNGSIIATKRNRIPRREQPNRAEGETRFGDEVTETVIVPGTRQRLEVPVFDFSWDSTKTGGVYRFSIENTQSGMKSRHSCITQDWGLVKLVSSDRQALLNQINQFQSGSQRAGLDIGMYWGAVFLDPSTNDAVGDLKALPSSPQVTSSNEIIQARPLAYDHVDTEGRRVKKVIVVISDGTMQNEMEILDDWNSDAPMTETGPGVGFSTEHWYYDDARLQAAHLHSITSWNFTRNNQIVAVLDDDGADDDNKTHPYVKLTRKQVPLFLSTYDVKALGIYSNRHGRAGTQEGTIQVFRTVSQKDANLQKICNATKKARENGDSIEIFAIGNAVQNRLRQCAGADNVFTLNQNTAANFERIFVTSDVPRLTD